MRRQNGRKTTVGTQTLDKCKDFIPTSVHTKNVKNKLLNAEIWSYVYQWQWRCNHRHALWQMVPKVPKGLCAWDIAPANEKGKKDRVRYGRRYSVFLWRPAFPTPSSWQGVSSEDGIWEIRTCFHIAVETFLTSRAHFGKRRKAPRTKRLCGSTWGPQEMFFIILAWKCQEPRWFVLKLSRTQLETGLELVHPSCTVLVPTTRLNSVEKNNFSPSFVHKTCFRELAWSYGAVSCSFKQNLPYLCCFDFMEIILNSWHLR